MIKISFEAANPAALNTLVGQYLVAAGIAAAAPTSAPAADVKPPKVDKPAAAPKPEAPAAPAASAPVNASGNAVTYDMIAAQVPKTASLGDKAKAKMKELMAKWGVNAAAGKKVKDVVPAEKYGEFFAELTAIDNG